VVEKCPQVYFGANRSKRERDKEYGGAERDTQALARDRLAIGALEDDEPLIGEKRYGDGHGIRISVDIRAR
jgi:hypothetical protein